LLGRHASGLVANGFQFFTRLAAVFSQEAFNVSFVGHLCHI